MLVALLEDLLGAIGGNVWPDQSRCGKPREMRAGRMERISRLRLAPGKPMVVIVVMTTISRLAPRKADCLEEETPAGSADSAHLRL